MKKLLSILLAACMLLTMLSLPAVAVEAQAEGDTYEYFKFPFNGDPGYTGNKCYYGLLKDDGSADAFWQPIRVSDGSAAIKVEMKQVDYNGARALRVRVAGGTAGQGVTIVPRTTNANARLQKPIKLTPGKNYAINYNIDITRYGNTSSSGRLMSEAYIVANGSADSSASLPPSASAITAAVINKSPAPVSGKDMRRAAYYFTTAGVASYKLLQGNKSASSSSVNIGAFGGLYSFAPTTINKYTSLGLTQMTGTITSDGSAVASSNNGTGKKTIQKREVMNALPVSDVEGDWNDLADWGITPRMASDGQFTGFYNYDYQANGTDDTYTDHFGITLPTNSSAEYIKVGEDFEAMAGTTIESGGETYGLAYNEYYIYDLEYYDTDNGAVNFVNGDDTATVVGAVGDTVTAPTAPVVEGKEFLGWYDAEGNKFVDGTAIVTGAPATYTARYASYTDNFKIDGTDIVFNATNDVAGTTVKSDFSMIAAVNDYYRITPVYGMLHKWADDVEIPYKSVAPALSRATATIGTKIGLPNTPANTEVGTLKMVSTTGANSQVSTLLDASGAPLLAKSNTQYMVKLAYKQLGAGTVRVRVGAGRSTTYATSGTNVATREDTRYQNISEVSGTAFNAKYKTLGAASLDYSEDVQYAFFNFATGDFGTDYIPEFNISTSTDGVLGRYTGKHYAGVPTNPNNPSDKWGSSNWGQYEIVGLPEFEIQSIEIIEVESGNSVVVYNDGDTMVEGVKGSELIPDNFEKTVYKTTGNTRESNKLKVFPEDNSLVYDYNDVLENVKYTQRTYIGCRGFAIDEAENALFYKPYTYDEYYDKYGVDIISSAALGEGVSLTGDQKLAKLKQTYESSIWNMYRLPIEETVDGATYKVTFSYKNEGEIPATLKFALGKLESVVDNEQQVLAETKVIAKTDEYTTATMFFTIEHSATVTANQEGADDTHEALGKYLYVYFNHSVADVNQTGRPEVYLKDIVVENLGTVVGIPGASCLTEEAAEAASQQAMRVYFSYKSTTGSNIFIDDVEYEVLERGIIYANGAIDKYTTVGGTEEAPTYKYYGDIKVGNGYTTYAKSENLDTAWAYDETTQELWYSNYIRNFRAGMENYKVLARGYIKFTDGENEYIVYSNTVNRSIEYLKDNCTDKIEEF